MSQALLHITVTLPYNQEKVVEGTRTNNVIKHDCYELKSLEWDKRTTLVLSNTRELDRELSYKLVYLI